MSKENLQPPKWADRFLSWYCNPKLLEQIQGDVHELFYWRIDEEGVSKARRSFAWDVIRLFRWSNIKRKSGQTQKINNMGMLKNYFKIGLRNLWKQRMPSLINGLGLALAIACCLVAYQFSEKDFIVDKFHKNKDRIHMVTPIHLIEGTPRAYARTRAHITDLIPENVAGIETLTRYYPGYGRIKVGENTFGNTISFVDPNFFQTFSYPVVMGEEKPLMDRGEVVLSRALAERFFGTEYPIGKAININCRGIKQDFIVSAVTENKQHESNLDVEIFIHYQSMPALKDAIGESSHAFLTIPDNVSIETVSKGIQALTALLPEEEASVYQRIALVPFTSLMDYGPSLIGTFAWGFNYDGIMIVGGIALFMLILAVFNYVNISTAMAMSRVKEIGIRKVVGSNRTQLIVQFLIENFILCSISLLVGLFLALTHFLPWFNVVSGESFFLDVLNNHRVVIFLVGLLVFITVTSGLYPAYTAARLQPTVIFKNATSVRSKKRLTGVLLTIQLTLALVTLVNALMFIYTEQEHKNGDWGFDRENLMEIGGIAKTDIDYLRNELKSLAVVESISSSKGGIAYLNTMGGVEFNGRTSPVRTTLAESGYEEIMGFRLRKGRFLDGDLIGDRTSSILVNSTFLTRTGVDSLNSKVTIGEEELTIVGIVEDYIYNGHAMVILPSIVRLGSEEDFDHLTVKVSEGAEELVEAKILSLFQGIENNNAEVTPMRDVMDDFFVETKRTQNLMVFCATIAMFLAAMGIFGLVSLNIKQSIKLYGIKKVLGAGMKHLYKDVYKPFGVIFLVAFIVGGSASVVLVTPILDMAHTDFPDINLGVIITGTSLLILVVAVTVNTQVRKLVRLNPVDTLRNE